ncbi:MAG TPA: tRNA (adenosine(37)-N6)-dimethylallyltransferase MiaA [Phycisphaerae bacterium]|nr:tRNA (adenosine(37)-N6)-dimethylallyltransferase MiaA [Phycisphaerae bacterium]
MGARPGNQANAEPLLLLIGCTASGKSDVGIHLAGILGAQIVSADSMMVYRRMDIGTAKPSSQQRSAVPHHLIDVVEPSEPFSVADYVERADEVISQLRGRGGRPLVVGGTALYLKTLTEGLFAGPSADVEFRRELRRRAQREGVPALHAELAVVDPDAAARIHPNDLRRIERALEVYDLSGKPISVLQQQWGRTRRYDCRFVGIRRAVGNLNHRINCRVRRMIDDGLVDEVRRLLAEPATLSRQARQALGYAQIIDHLEGRCSLEDAVEQIKILTRRFGKGQRTWFRRFDGVEWLDVEPNESPESIADRAEKVLRCHPAR